MFLSNRQVAAVVAAAAMLSVSAMAQAVTVSYYTVGTFGGGSSGASTTTSITNGGVAGPTFDQTASITLDRTTGTNSTGTSTLTYFNSSRAWEDLIGMSGPVSYDILDGTSEANFGYFKLAAGGDLASFAGVTFTLSIYQLQPQVADTGSQPLGGTFVGSFNGAGSSLKLTFAPTNTVRLPNTPTGVTYTLESMLGGPTYNIIRASPTTLDGTVAVPLPAPAVAGMAALGVVGWARLRRRSSVVSDRPTGAAMA